MRMKSSCLSNFSSQETRAEKTGTQIHLFSVSSVKHTLSVALRHEAGKESEPVPVSSEGRSHDDDEEEGLQPADE